LTKVSTTEVFGVEKSLKLLEVVWLTKVSTTEVFGVEKSLKLLDALVVF
jgi:hypothetical protein